MERFYAASDLDEAGIKAEEVLVKQVLRPVDTAIDDAEEYLDESLDKAVATPLPVNDDEEQRDAERREERAALQNELNAETARVRVSIAEANTEAGNMLEARVADITPVTTGMVVCEFLTK